MSPALPALGDVERRVRADPAAAAAAALVAVALVARLVALGARTAHFDEARVAYWALESLRTGRFEYRYIIHGPLLRYLGAAAFALLGTSDAAMRVPVALVGGLLPLAALLFRTRLRDAETVALAGFLALNPVLVYYSRFSRSTVLVAAFSLAALGLVVRAVDRRRPRLLVAAGAALALAFAAKENAAVYVLCFLGAGALVADGVLYAHRGHDSGAGRLRATLDRMRSLPRPAVRRWGRGVAGAAVAFLAVAFFFYAPRAGIGGGVGLHAALLSPGQFPDLVAATVDDVATGFGYWFGGATEPGCNEETVVAGYLCYLRQFLATMGAYAAPLSALAVVGFALDRYARDRPRALVQFAGFWGAASVVGYPLGTDIWGAWVVVNALVPLAVPAAVGAGAVYRAGREAVAAGDRTTLASLCLVALVATGATGAGLAGGVYTNYQSADNRLVQYAQPASHVETPMDDVAAVAGDHAGTDALLYGESLTLPPDRSGAVAPDCAELVNTLPLQWYLSRAGATGDCVRDEAALARALRSDPPPVVIAPYGDRATVARELDRTGREYETQSGLIRTSGERLAFFVRSDGG
jgi:uncharacterized protein (TIGR03663 family)